VSAPSLRVRVERDGGVCVLAVRGELDIATIPELARKAAAALQIPPVRLVLDLSGLEFIDCAGAQALAAVTETVPAGCPITVGSMSCAAQRVLGVLGMTLERPGAAATGEVPWTVPESQVLLSWRQQLRAEIAGRLRRRRRARALGRIVGVDPVAARVSLAVRERANGPDSGR
jgi:anti-anti-sigma factor